MSKSVSRKSDGPTTVETENVGDDITADHLTPKDEQEESIDGDRVETGSELEKGNPLRKYKGRTASQGNNVKDEPAETGLFAEPGSSPANMHGNWKIHRLLQMHAWEQGITGRWKAGLHSSSHEDRGLGLLDEILKLVPAI